MSTARRIAVLMGSHPPSRFARDMQEQRPSEAAVLAALRAQRNQSEAGRPGSPTRAHAGDGRSVTRHASARLGAGTRRAHPRGSHAAYSDRDPLSAKAAAPPSRENGRTRVVGSLMSRWDGRAPSHLRRGGAGLRNSGARALRCARLLGHPGLRNRRATPETFTVVGAE